MVICIEHMSGGDGGDSIRKTCNVKQMVHVRERPGTEEEDDGNEEQE